jgi:hypothetical protein
MHTLISDPNRWPRVAAVRRADGVLLHSGGDLVFLSASELTRLAEYLATDPVPTTTSPAKARLVSVRPTKGHSHPSRRILSHENGSPV